MKAKKIIIIALSALVVALIVALLSVSIAAGNENLSIAEYFAKITNNESAKGDTLVTINGEKTGVSAIDSMIRLYAAVDTVYTSELAEKDLRLYIDRVLLSQEAKRRGITADEDEVARSMNSQKEILLSAAATGDKVAQFYVDYYKELGMTVDEYFNTDDARAQYVENNRVYKLLKQEAAQKNITEDEAREELLKELRANAEIEINQRNLELLKSEADEVAAKTAERLAEKSAAVTE